MWIFACWGGGINGERVCIEFKRLFNIAVQSQPAILDEKTTTWLNLEDPLASGVRSMFMVFLSAPRKAPK